MAVYWMTEALPLPITSLIPVVGFPLLGVMNTSQVCVNYFTETIMMFIGGLIVGLAVEYSNLHKRIALRVILSVGSDPKWLMLGFMAVTMFLSMWVSNTGSTAMIVPIVEALISELYQNSLDNNEMQFSLVSDDAENPTPLKCQTTERWRHLRVTLLLAVAYSANIGGTGTLIGSTPQLALKGIVEEFYGPNTDLTFTSWMMINVPAMLINTFITWLWLLLVLRRFKCRSEDLTSEDDKGTGNKIRVMLRKKYQELGPMSYHESTVLVLFVILISLWMFRDPKFVPGWGSLFSKKIGDSVPVLLVIFVLFILPAKLNFWCFASPSSGEPPKTNEAMLDWTYLQQRLPWGLVLLLGSGFAMSDASKVSGLSAWMGEQLTVLAVLPNFAILVIVCFLTSWMTEVVSNTATANIVLPILAKMAEKLKLNPLYFMVPAATTCGYSFCLPVGTPPNAIVYSAANMKPGEMVKSGLVTNLVCVAVLSVVMETIGTLVFPIDGVLQKLSEQTQTNLTLIANGTSLLPGF